MLARSPCSPLSTPYTPMHTSPSFPFPFRLSNTLGLLSSSSSPSYDHTHPDADDTPDVFIPGIPIFPDSLFNALPSRHIHRITQLGDDTATGWVRKPSGEYEYIPPGVIQEVDDEYELDLESSQDMDMDMDVDMDGYNPSHHPDMMILALPKDVPPPPTPDLRSRRLELLPESFPSTMHSLQYLHQTHQSYPSLNEPAPSSSFTLSLSDSSVVSEDESSVLRAEAEEGQEEREGDLHCSRPCTPSVSTTSMHPGPTSPLRHAFDGMSLLSSSSPQAASQSVSQSAVDPTISNPIKSTSSSSPSNASSSASASLMPMPASSISMDSRPTKTTPPRVIINQNLTMITSISSTLRTLEDALERQSADFELGGHVDVCRRVRRAVGLVEESLRGACACEGLNWGEGEKREGREGKGSKWEERLDSLHRTLTRLRTLLEYLIPPSSSSSPTSSHTSPSHTSPPHTSSKTAMKKETKKEVKMRMDEKVLASCVEKMEEYERKFGNLAIKLRVHRRSNNGIIKGVRAKGNGLGGSTRERVRMVQGRCAMTMNMTMQGGGGGGVGGRDEGRGGIVGSVRRSPVVKRRSSISGQGF